MDKIDPIRIMVVDDHHFVRKGVVSIINMEIDMQVVAEAADGAEAIKLFEQCKPDVTLMDLRLPNTSGVEAIKAIRRDFPGSRFIVLTTFDGDEDIYRALQAGAQGYLLKDMFSEEVLEAIRTVHSGRRRIPANIAERLASRMESDELSSREIEVLKLIAKGKSNKEIGTTLDISEATVKSHVNSILSKLSANDRTHAATIALQRGIIHL
jgi:DNA-binding NarL/FixJ family response regulator